MKVLPLQCKRLDFHVTRMTTENGGPVSSWRRKNRSLISTFMVNVLTVKQSAFFSICQNENPWHPLLTLITFLSLQSIFM